MKNLRLVFNNIDGRRVDITLPMEKWISDWWFECNIVPENNTIILVAELDGKSILDGIQAIDEGYVQFEEVAWYFNWDGLYDDFVGVTKGNKSFGNNSADFEKWLQKNITQ